MTPAELRHALPAAEAARELLAAPLTAYQAAAAATISEPNADATGYRWPVVCILWPRQTGKTTLILCTALGRARRMRDYRAAYAAQTGHITSQRFKEWIGAVHRRPGWALDYRTRSSDGTERITVRATSSYLRAFPPIPGRLRSAALDLVVVDEAQEHDDDRVGQQLDADIQPTFDTRPRGQWIIAGTAGDASSTYWARHYANAAAGAPGHLLLELGTPPPGADLDDPATWAAHHPGLLAGRTTLERLHQARATLGPDRFAREYLNQWGAAVADTLFPSGAWAACHDPAAGITGPVTLALEVPTDRETAYILAAGTSTVDPDRVHLELVAAQPLALAVPTAARLAAEHRTPIIVDPQAPGVTHIEPLRRARVPLYQTTAADVVTGSLSLYDAITERRITHLDQPPLTAAAATAQRRRVGARWAFERNAPGGAIIMAAALAHHRHHRRTGTEPRTIEA
jgi:hypothetical protein